MLKLSRLKNLTGERLRDLLSPEGFEYDHAVDGVEMFRWRDDVFLRIACVVNRIGSDNCVTPFGQMGLRETQKIWQKYMLDSSLPFPDHSVDLTIDYADLVKDWNATIVCNEETELEKLHSLLKDTVLNKLFPMLTEYSDPKKLVDLYLSKNISEDSDFSLPGWRGYETALNALILSKLYAPEFYNGQKKKYKPVFESELKLETTRRNVSDLINFLDNYQL